MTLRTRLFLTFAAFVALVVAAQQWWLQTLTRELQDDTDALAMFVGTSVARAMTVDPGCPEGQDDCLRVLHLDGSSEVERLGDDLAGADKALEKLHHLLETDGLLKRRLQKGGGPGLRAVWVPDGEGAVETSEIRGKVLHRIVVSGSSEPPEQPGESPPEGARRASTGSPVVLSTLDLTREGLESALLDGHRVRLRVDATEPSRVLVVERPGGKAQVPIPRPGEKALERIRERLWWGSGLLMLLGLGLAALLAHRVSAPLRRLSSAAVEVGEGALGTRVDARGGDREIRATVGAFNRMSGRLAELDAETRRLEALKHLEELGDVARGFAHTLRNPLNALGLTVEELAAGVDGTGGDAAGGEALESARRQIRRIDQGIRSFLLLADHGSHGDGPAVEAVDVAELVKDVALEALQDAAGRSSLEVHVDPELDARRPALEPELRAVVQALVVNAVEASPPGARVDVRLDAGDGERLLLRVEDRGPGLPPEIRRRLFTPHLSTKAAGSGMGLFLAHRIAVHRYDGRLELIDRDGGGLRAELEIGPRRALQTAKEAA